MTDVFIGLDGEMTGGGRDPKMRPGWKFFQLVQIGVSYRDEIGDYSAFSANIGYDKWNEEPEAMKVHGLTADDILNAPRQWDVDKGLLAWLDEQQIQRAIPVGWGVGSFDMPYVREYLPRSAERISKRSVDLTAIAYTIQEITGRSFNGVKNAAKKYAEKRIGEVVNWHDAGYDAEAALHAWEFFKQILVVRELHDHF